MKSPIYGHLAALLVVTIWGTTFISSKVLLNHGMQPAEIFILRFFMAYVCVSVISHKQMWAANWKDELTMLGLGIMGGSLYFQTENQALAYSTASNVSILVSTTPLLTALLIAIFYKNERMNSKQILGSFIAFIGVVLVVMNGQFILHLNPKGDSLALTASLTWAIYSLLMRRLMGRYNSIFITRKVFGYGLLTILPYFYFIEPFNADIVLNGGPVIICNLLYLGLCASTGGFLIWNWVMPRLGAVKSTNYIYTQSIISMIGSALILGERITLMAIIGVFVLTFGMIMAQRNKNRKKA